MKHFTASSRNFLLVLIFLAKLAQAQFYESKIGAPSGIDQFRTADEIAIDKLGNVYVLDRSSLAIKKFNNVGVPLLQWEIGATFPNGIAVGKSGDIYIADGSSHGILKFNQDGVLLGRWGQYGPGFGDFSNPIAVVVDQDENVYVADHGNFRIQKFDSSGKYISNWGSQGSGDGEFASPQKMAVDNNGNILVLDPACYCIQKFSGQGKFLEKWGEQGSGDGQLNFPRGIAIDASNNIHVSEYYRVQKFSSSGSFTKKYGSYGGGIGQFQDGGAIAADRNGNVYLLDITNPKVHKFNSEGSFLVQWGDNPKINGRLHRPNGVVVDPNGNIFVVDTHNHRIQKFNKAGDFLISWGSLGTEDGKFNSPCGIAIDKNGDVYISDAIGRIQKFNSSGSFLKKWGGYGTANGQLNSPTGLTIDADGNILVVDSGNNRIQKFSTSGAFLSKWGINGQGNGQFNRPSGIAISRIGDIYVADFYNLRIQKFKSTGEYVTSFVLNDYPHSITLDGDENLLVTLSLTNRIGKYKASGELLGHFGSLGSANGQFRYPAGIAFDPEGYLYVADFENHRIQKFSYLRINSFSTTSGLPGSSFSIKGTGFSPVLNENKVLLGESQCVVNAVNSTSLTVTVPEGATTGSITVEREGVIAKSPGEFLVLPLTITSFMPKIAGVGVPITIEGSGFSSIQANNQVSFNGIAGEVISSSATRIVARLPAGDTSGKIIVTTLGKIATSTTDFIYTKLLINEVVYPEFFVMGELSAQIKISVSDINEVQSIKFNSKAITADDASIKSEDIPVLTSSNQIEFPIPNSYFSDPIGLHFVLSVNDKEGNEVFSDQRFVYLKYPATSNRHIIPDLKSGNKVSDYQLISIPLELEKVFVDDVFANLGEYNIKKWRIFFYDNNKAENVENRFLMQPGIGYWFIMRDNHEINPGTGNTVKVTPASPFKIQLKKGWNLIGNPYNFTISLNDVVEYNQLPADLLKFRQYINGSFVSEPLLKRYRGAFIYSDTELEIGIPIISHGGTGGRKKDNQIRLPLDAKEWKVNLTLQDGEISNELFGFGMNPNAKEDKDMWDEVSLPMLEGMSSFNMIFRQLQNKDLTTDIVSRQDNYSWQASVSNEQPINVHWDNDYFGDNNQQLFLESSSEVEVIDMRTSNTLSLPAGDHIIRFHYGDPTYVKRKIIENNSRIGEIYPNPIRRGVEPLSISVSLPDGKNEVSLRLRDMIGKPAVLLSSDRYYDGGRKAVELQDDFSNLPAGMYLLQVRIKDAKGITSLVHRKLIIE